jgi:hypothetical protein
MVDDRRIWMVYTTKPVLGSWGTVAGIGHRSSDFHIDRGELRGIGAGIESDGSLRFVEGRVQSNAKRRAHNSLGEVRAWPDWR